MVGPSPIRVLANGQWPRSQVRCEWVPSTLALSPEQEVAVETAWIQAGKRPGIDLFDGALCRLEHLTVTADTLVCAVSHTSYRTFIGTNAAHPEWGDQAESQNLANPIGISALVRSSDRLLVGGYRSQSVALYPSCAHPFGGMLESGASTPDSFADIQRELNEEIALTPSDITSIQLIGVIEDPTLRQPELIFSVLTHLPIDELKHRLDKTEHTSLWQVADNDVAVSTAIATPQHLTPIMIASLLLHGQQQWGDSWLAPHRSLFDFSARQPPEAQGE